LGYEVGVAKHLFLVFGNGKQQVRAYEWRSEQGFSGAFESPTLPIQEAFSKGRHITGGLKIPHKIGLLEKYKVSPEVGLSTLGTKPCRSII